MLNFGATPFKYSYSDLEYRSLYNANPVDIVEETSSEAHGSQEKAKPLAIILEPAKDLAEQVCQAIQSYSRYVTNPSITSLLLVGGDNSSKQKDALRKGVDVIVGTPGKIVDLTNKEPLISQPFVSSFSMKLIV